ncbi:MAG: response regulator [Thermodesulfovibrio sp.]|jgi:DNA-binding response OmpR family regulator|uniref:Response regulatory domain-containing protein n=1 Tax=Thermodesulfovibrio obliviosus TaxID=3118332 RepID=A0AAU8H6I4_9BACT
MYKIFLLEKLPFLSDYLGSLKEDNFSIITFSETDKALQSIEELSPQLIVLGVDVKESDLINFLQKIREKYSLLLPVLAVLNFYSSINFEQLRNLGVDFIVKPFTLEEFKQKIQSLLGIKQQCFVGEKEDELINKLRPYISREVKREMQNIFKKILEVL